MYYILGGIVCLIATIVWLKSKKSEHDIDSRLPPVYGGWIPWLGCAIEFGKAPLLQIAERKRQMGSLFTLYVAGKRLTFLTAPQDFHHFFQSPNVDFQQAVTDAVYHAASIPESAFFRNHTKLHDTVKGRLSSQSLSQIGEHLCQELHDQMQQFQIKGKVELFITVRHLLYRSVINNLFGQEILNENEDDFQTLEKHFLNFDEQFEYGTQLPEFVMRNWAVSKHWLLSKFNLAVQKAKKKTNPDYLTLFQSLLEKVEAGQSHRFGLLFLWASLANAVPLTFWSLSRILAEAAILHKVKTEIQDCLGAFQQGKYKQLTEDTLQQMPFTKCCILETIRLHSVGVITRKVIQTFKIQGYTIPKGDLLMLSPYWAHRNSTYFPEPNKFNPDRWKGVDFEKKLFMEGFVGFGSGRYQCPGRWFALMEIHMFIALFLWRYDINLLDKVPDESPYHVVGTQQPLSACHVQVRPC